ncbi:stage II sporulation protein M [Methanolobus sp. ZRKC2]|uniref:stage II sporulation protein M n=1 Tax=Methanolobus sp. ZRKC2 TaxID=3125783 RepID=UPI00325604E8
MFNEDSRTTFRAYFRELKPYIIASTTLFVLAMIAGYIAYGLIPEFSADSLSGLEEIAEMLQNLSAFEIMLFIFFNNATKMFAAILLGPIFGLVPIAFLLLNGFVLGVFVHLQIIENGALFIIAGLTPHGIIEIPMLLISSAIGLKLGHETFKIILGKPSNLKDELIKGVQFFLYILLPLIFLAAVIETFITPLVIYLVSGV